MSHTFSFLFCLALLGKVLVVQSWNPISIHQIPKANATDRVEVFVMEAPLMFEQFGPALGNLNLYHMGMGFHNLDTDAKWEMGFCGEPDFVHAIFPQFVKENGTIDLRWKSFGAAILFEGINTTYWQSEMWKVSTLTGEQHNLYVDKFLSQVNSTRKYYDLFDVFADFPDGDRFIESYTCMDFVWETLGWLKETANATLDYSVKLKRDYTIFYTHTEPEEVSLHGPHHDDIVSFYQLIEGKFKELGLFHFILELVGVLSGKVYVRQGKSDKYYYVKLKPPYFGLKYAYTPMPGQTFSPAERAMMKQIEAQEEIQAEKNRIRMRDHERVLKALGN